jgi:DNA polymerase I
VPVCLCAHELYSGRCFRLMLNQTAPARPPWATGPDVLFVAFFASAELGCFRVLGWPMPTRILDLFAEFRWLTNGYPVSRSLLAALAYFGLDHTGAGGKKEMQEAIGNGTWRGKYSDLEVLDYCWADVDATERLLCAMWPRIDLPRALVRGRYMAAVSAMEHAGVPIDVLTLNRLREAWPHIQDRLIADVDRDYGLFDGRTFKMERFEAWLARNNMAWPRLQSGQLDLEDDTFHEMARIHPSVAPIRELRSALSSLRLNDLTVGRDGRNRTLISPFGARSGRNTPSNSRFIFGPSKWLRGLIKPPPGFAVAYLDFKAQEFAIAAALSGDANMMAAYASGDCYLTFAKQAGAVPADATQATHDTERQLFKTAALAVQYGMSAEGLARRLDQAPIVGRDLLRAHREVYRRFWSWSDSAVDTAMLTGELRTAFGWTVHVGAESNPRSLRNFPMQGGGSDMLRIACCLATERGIEVVAPVHDAIMILSPLDNIEANIEATRKAMVEASLAVLPGFPLEVDVKTVCYPERYSDRRGSVMWRKTMALLDQIDTSERAIA